MRIILKGSDGCYWSNDLISERVSGQLSLISGVFFCGFHQSEKLRFNDTTNLILSEILKQLIHFFLIYQIIDTVFSKVKPRNFFNWLTINVIYNRKFKLFKYFNLSKDS